MKLKDLLEQYGEYDVVLSKREARNEIMIEGRKPKPKTVWDLAKDDDNYFVVYNDGDVVEYRWCDTGLGKAFRDQGTVFLTRKEAEEEAERRAVETLLIKHGGRRWFTGASDNWYLFSLDNVKACVEYTSDPIQGVIYFDSKEEARKAIEQIGEDRIIKALFEVR